MGGTGSSAFTVRVVRGGIRHFLQTSLNYVRGVTIGGENFLEVLQLGLGVVGVAYPLGFVCQAFDDACFDSRVVVGSEVEVAVCVGFLYTVVRPMPSLCTNTSRNGSLLSSSISMVNSMLCLSELMWERKSSRESHPLRQMMKVSSTYRNHREGGCLAVLMAIVSKYSMYRSASTPLKLFIQVIFESNVDFIQNSVRW